MKNIIALVLFLSPALNFAQTVFPIAPAMYSWREPQKKISRNILASGLVDGSAADMAYLQMNANSIASSKSKTKLRVPATEEHLLLVKDGVVTVSIKDSTWSLNPGSIVLLLPGEKYALQNKGKGISTYFEMKYRSKSPVDQARANAAGSSFVKEWDKITFKPHERGGIRNYFERATAMCKRLEMHVTTLNEGIKSHEPHTHRAEEIVLIIDNKTEMQIGDKFYKGGAGDLYYLGSNVLHAIRNDGTGSCVYFAFQFE